MWLMIYTLIYEAPCSSSQRLVIVPGKVLQKRNEDGDMLLLALSVADQSVIRDMQQLVLDASPGSALNS